MTTARLPPCSNNKIIRIDSSIKTKAKSTAHIPTTTMLRLATKVMWILDLRLCFLSYVDFRFLISVWMIVCVSFYNQLLQQPKYRKLIIKLIKKDNLFSSRIFNYIPVNIINTNALLINTMKRIFVNPCDFYNDIYTGDPFQVDNLIGMFYINLFVMMFTVIFLLIILLRLIFRFSVKIILFD